MAIQHFLHPVRRAPGESRHHFVREVSEETFRFQGPPDQSRIAEVEEVANLVVMLASPMMEMVNGTMIEIDGGQDKPLMDRFRDRPNA